MIQSIIADAKSRRWIPFLDGDGEGSSLSSVFILVGIIDALTVRCVGVSYEYLKLDCSLNCETEIFTDVPVNYKKNEIHKHKCAILDREHFTI